MDHLSQLAVKLFDIGAIKFGKFTLKSGIESPIYFDLRVIISFPEIMVEVSELLWQASQRRSCPFVSVCGVPYTALPLATLIAANNQIPMLIRRKEAKGYGTKKLIEGRYSSGDVCLIVEDVVTSGSSVLETAESLSTEGIRVSDAVVLLDRQQGGKDRLKEAGITLHCVMSISDLLRWLLDAKKVDSCTVDQVRVFLDANQCERVQSDLPPKSVAETKTLSYEARAALAKNARAKQLFEIMHQKKTNLALSADVADSQALLQLADSVGPYICVLKTHVDILEDFHMSAMVQLKVLAEKHNFLVFEDRKFADIGHTVQLQFEGGTYRISEWADIVDAHCLPGPGVVESLKKVNPSVGCLLIAEMSSEGNLISEPYTQETVKIAESHRDTVIGFVSQKRVSDDPGFLHFTPGVHTDSTGDGQGQQYVSPRDVIQKRHSDILIVGRGIFEAGDPVATASLYRDAGYGAYLELTL